jgi:hypothetical protein
MPVFALTIKVEVKISQLGRKGVGINAGSGLTGLIDPGNGTVPDRFGVRERHFKHVGSRYALHFRILLAEAGRTGTRQKHPEHIAPFCPVSTEEGKRVVVTGRQDALNV